MPKIFIGSHELLNEVCDEKRFTKAVQGGLANIRNGVHDGLFTARDGEHNWGVAHRILMPAFGPLSIRTMYDGMKSSMYGVWVLLVNLLTRLIEMYDIASQLVLKWARYGDETPINVTDDFTRLTLDSIAL